MRCTYTCHCNIFEASHISIMQELSNFELFRDEGSYVDRVREFPLRSAVRNTSNAVDINARRYNPLMQARSFSSGGTSSNSMLSRAGMVILRESSVRGQPDSSRKSGVQNEIELNRVEWISFQCCSLKGFEFTSTRDQPCTTFKSNKWSQAHQFLILILKGHRVNGMPVKSSILVT
jgi:hypothetical protein